MMHHTLDVLYMLFMLMYRTGMRVQVRTLHKLSVLLMTNCSIHQCVPQNDIMITSGYCMQSASCNACEDSLLPFFEDLKPELHWQISNTELCAETEVGIIYTEAPSTCDSSTVSHCTLCAYGYASRPTGACQHEA